MPFDCVVCGTCCVDLVLNPMPLDTAFGLDRMRRINSPRAMTGGMVSNAGNAMARLGLRVAAVTYVGQDHWASIIVDDLKSNHVDTSRIVSRPEASTSVTAVLIDDEGRHSFGYHDGVMDLLDAELIRDNLDLFADSQFALIGYYALNRDFDQLLVDLIPEIRETGCRVALDSAGDGGTLKPLDQLLPHLDFYIPSLAEGQAQTGETDPERIIEVYRRCGATGVLGITLGSKGAVLSLNRDEMIAIAAVTPPGPIVDTTGAGDSFFAGLLAGVVRKTSIEDAGKLGAAAAACCVTEFAGTAGIRSFSETAKLAGLA